MNLLNNAIKYTNKGDIELCAINTGKTIKISVKDTGIGIPSERLSQLFNMFSGITDNSLGGLGLDVSQKILKQLKSEMHVQSTIGLGSCFTFDLKISNDIPEDSTSWENEIPNEGQKCYTVRTMSSKCSENDIASILIADDNDFNRMCLAKILKKKNIKFEEVVNGYDAIEKVLEYDKAGYAFKCVIMDCEMPVMDGWEASKIITNYYTQGRIKMLPAIIAHTAYSSKEDIQRCYDSGMISYIVKPTPQEVILSIVDKYA
jgi:CheY-like chemotaxis protein